MPRATGKLNSIPASGWISSTTRTLKNGSTATYFVYRYSEKVDGKWKDRKRSISKDKVPLVQKAIADKLGYDYICRLISKKPLE